MTKSINMNVSEQELQLVEVFRQAGNFKYFSMLVENRDGAWDIELRIKKEAGIREARVRGVGETFEDAWASMDPTSG